MYSLNYYPITIFHMTLDETGAVKSAQDYYPYGKLSRSYDNSDPNGKYKFTSKERDNETNYDYFGARYYNNDLGVWLQIDPLADKYPGYSPYNYVMGNPLVFYDPDGRSVGNFYDVEGNKIGNDGKDDGEVYVVKEGEEETVKLFLGLKSVGAQNIVNSLSFRMPNQSFRREILTSFVTMTKNYNSRDANIQEEGGVIYSSNEGNEYNVAAQRGEAWSEGQNYVGINVWNPRSDREMNTVPSGATSIFTYHTHPQNGWDSVNWGQAPSQTDINNAGGSDSHLTNFVISNNVYIYNSQGTQATISKKIFAKLK